jgi:hypothetical protein
MEAEAKLELEGRSKPNAEKFLGSFTEADVALATEAGSDPLREWRIASSGSRKSSLVALSYKRGELGGRLAGAAVLRQAFSQGGS